MFKQRTQKFRKRTTGQASTSGNDAITSHSPSLLSFDQETQDLKKKKAKRRLARRLDTHPRNDEIETEELNGPRYDAESLAELRSLQQSLPVVHDEDAPVAVAAESAAPEQNLAPDYIPILAGPREIAEEEHRQRWLRAGADGGDVDAPTPKDLLALGAERVGEAVDDEDDELHRWENDVVARGSAFIASATRREQAPVSSPKVLPPPKNANVDEDLDKAVAQASEETAKAERDLNARQAELTEHEATLASAAAQAAKAQASLTSLRAAKKVLSLAVQIYQSSDDAGQTSTRAAALRIAMSQAVSLAEAADEDDPLNLAGVYIRQDHAVNGDEDEAGIASPVR